MKELLETPILGILLSILTYEIGLTIYRKTRIAFFNPLFISIVISIFVLLGCNISLDTFNIGGDYISFFLGPATVILAVPLYKQLPLLKANIVSILAGITVGCISAITSVLVSIKLSSLDTPLAISLIPKSITTPIAISTSNLMGGIPAVTVAAVLITGITGTVLGPTLCKLFKIHDKIAVGVAIGTSSHALGTTRAMELGETEGAMSSLSIGIAGLFTVVIAPVLTKLLH